MEELDAQLVVQAYNERMYNLMTELVLKDAAIKQLKKEMQTLMDVIRTQGAAKKTDEKKEKNS